MKYFYKLFFSFFLLPFFSIAQSNYQPGYVVTSKGDTLHGFINYKEWDKNPKDIRFKNSLSASGDESFSKKNASAFAITGLEYYQRFILSISQDQVDMGKLETKPDTSHLTDTVFLRMVTKGKHLTLYSYTDNIKLRLYILKDGDTQPMELIFRAYYNPNESAAMQYIRRYRTQLENLAQKYDTNTDKVKEQILQANYDESEIIKIVQTINGASSAQFTPQNLAGTRWFAGIGANYSSLKFEGAGFIFDGQGASSFFPKIAAGVDFFINKNIQSLLFRAEYVFTVNQYKLATSGSVPFPSTSSLNFSQYNNSIIPQVIFNIYNKQQLKVFVDAGASFNLSFYNSYQLITKMTGSFPSVTVMNKYPGFEQFWFSFPIKAGVVLNKKIEISICYISSSAISQYSEFSGQATSIQAGVNYLFGNK